MIDSLGRTHNNPTGVNQYKYSHGVGRILELVGPDDENGCWPWQGRLKSANRRYQRYGKAWWRGQTRHAHRAVWEIHNGEIPDGMTLDHLCLNKWCVNPAHLEVVTQGENTRRHFERLGGKHCHTCTCEGGAVGGG